MLLELGEVMGVVEIVHLYLGHFKLFRILTEGHTRSSSHFWGCKIILQLNLYLVFTIVHPPLTKL